MNALKPRGAFPYQPVLGAHRSDPAQVALDREWMGLPWSAFFLYGSVRDEQGELYTLLRRPVAHGGGRERFFLQSTLGGETNLRVHPASRGSVRNTGFVRSFADGTMQISSAASEPGLPFSVEITDTTFEWVEQDVMSLRGTLVQPGLHWHLPHGDEGYYYVSQIYEVEGEILGQRVMGFIGADDMYMHGQIYQDDLLIGDQLHISWYTWATRYVDGSLEAGHFMLGHDGMRFALLCDENGRVTRTTNVDGRVVLADGVWPARIEIEAEGTSWEFLPDDRGRMVDFMPIPTLRSKAAGARSAILANRRAGSPSVKWRPATAPRCGRTRIDEGIMSGPDSRQIPERRRSPSNTGQLILPD